VNECIMVGIDLHDATLVTQTAVGKEAPQEGRWENTPEGRRALWEHLRRMKRRRGAGRAVLAYEASCQGFGLCDEAFDEGFECHVLAPTRLAASSKSRKQKSDAKDALRLLDALRAHVPAGSELPRVWVPDPQTRQDREVVRMRLEVGQKLTSVKAQIQTLLKRHGLRRPSGTGRGWTGAFVAWLRGLCAPAGDLGCGAAQALGSLLRQRDWFEEEIARLDAAVARLSAAERYAEPVAKITEVKGAGLLTAMVYLTELGGLRRFANRREIAAYLGLAPASYESGERDDRKGHITRQGPWRVRRALCQSAWTHLRFDEGERAAYERIAKKNAKHKKIALVAVMRRLAIRLWHIGRDAQAAHVRFPEPRPTPA